MASAGPTEARADTPRGVPQPREIPNFVTDRRLPSELLTRGMPQTPEIPISTFRLDHVLQAKLYAAGSRSAREYLARMSGAPTAASGAGEKAGGGGGMGGGTRLMTGSAGVRPDPQHLLLIKRFVSSV